MVVITFVNILDSSVKEAIFSRYEEISCGFLFRFRRRFFVSIAGWDVGTKVRHIGANLDLPITH